jgi:SAM-dependent methyltransferase
MRVNCPICASENIRFLSHYLNEKAYFLGADSIRACQSCGLVFAWPMPPDDELVGYYREGAYYDDKAPYAGDFHDFSYQLAHSRLRLIARHLALDGIPRWLDVGAGNAVLGYALKELQPEATYEAVEPSASCRSGWGEWVSAAFDDLSAAPLESYNVITLNQVLEHVNQPLRFLKGIAKHLVKGGVVYIDVPHRDDLFKPTIEPHLLFWEKGSLSSAVIRAGFETLFCESAGMKRARARRFFTPVFLDRVLDPWRWVVRMNKVLARTGVERTINTFPQFQADRYGGDRQWLRCLARKVNE